VAPEPEDMDEVGIARALTNSAAAARGITRSKLGSNYTRVLHGVHIHNSVEPSLEARCAAAGLVLPSDATFSDLTGVELLGLPLPFGVPRSRLLDVTVAPPFDRPVGRGVRGHRRQLHPAEVTVIGGLRVTTAARTFVDLAPVVDEPNLIVVGDAILRKGLASLASLEAAVREAAGRRGVLRARLAVARLDGRSASAPESLLRVRIEDAGLPRPALNVDVYDSCGGWIACPDMLYEEAKIAVEYEGERHLVKRQFGLDLARDQLLTLAGFVVVRAGPRDLPAHATTLPDTLRRLLEVRAPWMLGN
jgi:very-short-patch-repair endonuclease